MKKKAIVTYSFTNNVPMRTASEVLKKGLPKHTEHIPMVHTDSFPPLTTNQSSVEELNMRYMAMFEGVAKQISDLTQAITSICELLSKLAPKHFRNAVCSLTKSVENINREG